MDNTTSTKHDGFLSILDRKPQQARKLTKRYGIFELSNGTHNAVRKADHRDFLDSKAAENACIEILKIQPEKTLIILPTISTQEICN